jgi:glycosyl-4,4'-diaponeurosporenoate acyltransferase
VTRPLLVLVDVVAWAVIHASTGYLVHRLPAARFDHDSWLTRRRRVERDGRLYADLFAVKRWKHRLPEAGALFAGGTDKRRLGGTTDADLVRYATETRRAEVGHWLAAGGAPLFALWNPWWVALLMVAYATAANGPCIVAVRYNRLRILHILDRRSVSSG